MSSNNIICSISISISIYQTTIIFYPFNIFLKKQKRAMTMLLNGFNECLFASLYITFCLLIFYFTNPPPTSLNQKYLTIDTTLLSFISTNHCSNINYHPITTTTTINNNNSPDNNNNN
ncbi:hypothetical protein PPL_11847 [Heterostelium album PN500]|uniref:Uncharacterized protein n=1 Tax=Heterostelium pallidum (strain ATCC 26659 / Pp 5 / PN500) TaxID=670386 RepID=D3BUM6_HETP5|nr:hypothetical protein PPL_11847 [Heterostelium album PN500]EFA74814.1 hypothetical protein PPL_11847 [Heterostelium album PN500]|eukprot:XP_020426948.1 hypothetical protein PPL_11847 [Heterostelium album PN500]